jgi:hypothetical protein
MASLSIFDHDQFGVNKLTLAINDLKDVKPTRLQQLGWFHEEGITTTYADIERSSEGLQLVSSKDRGSPGQTVQGESRKTVPVKAIHLPQTASIMADQVQNVRAFGTQNDLETVQSQVDKKLMRMRNNLDSTIEYHRIKAMQGKILDADGTTVLLDLFNLFGLVKQTHSLKLTDSAANLRIEILKAKKMSSDKLKGKKIDSWHALLSYDLFEKYLENPVFEKAWERYQSGEMLRNDPMAEGFVFANVKWELYDYAIDDKKYIDDGKGILTPVGITDFCQSRYAPANYEETVNTEGLPYYAKMERMQFDKGQEMESQSNVINICSNPDAVIELTVE